MCLIALEDREKGKCKFLRFAKRATDFQGSVCTTNAPQQRRHWGSS